MPDRRAASRSASWSLTCPRTNVGFGLLIPQFYAPAAVRIGHGVLVAAGAAWIALSLWNTTQRQQRTAELLT
jgi:hypothetical protein